MLDNALILFYQLLSRHVPLKLRYPVVYKAFSDVGIPMSGQEPWTGAQLMIADIIYSIIMEYSLFCMIISNPTITQHLVELVPNSKTNDSRCLETRLLSNWYFPKIVQDVLQIVVNQHYEKLKRNGKLVLEIPILSVSYLEKDEFPVSQIDGYPFFVHEMWMLANSSTNPTTVPSVYDLTGLYPAYVKILKSLFGISRFQFMYRDLFFKFMNCLHNLEKWSHALQDIPGHLSQIATHVCTVVTLLALGTTANESYEKEAAESFMYLLITNPKLFLIVEKEIMNAFSLQMMCAENVTKISTQSLQGRPTPNRHIRFRLRLHRIARVDELVNPHVYAFITHHAGAPTHRVANSPLSMLELMYLHSQGHMQRVDESSDDFYTYNLPVDNEDAAARAGDDLRVYFVVMYESTLEKPRTIIPPYQVEAHAHVRVNILERHSQTDGGPIMIPAGCGPVDSTLEFNPDESTSKPFGFVIDSIIELERLDRLEQTLPPRPRADERVKREIQTIMGTEKMKLWSQQRLLSGAHASTNEREINASIHKQVMAVRNVSKVDQTLAYMSYPMEILGLLAVTYMRGPPIKGQRFDVSVANALFAHRMNPKAFVELVEYLEQDNCKDEWAFTIFKQIACQSLNFANMLMYRGDRLNGADVDDMRNIRQTGFGDCEDMGECIYKDIETFIGMNDEEFENIATVRLKGVIAKHYVPCFTVMYVKYDGSPMHCVASLVPQRKFSTRSAPNSNSSIFKTIMFEGTNPVYPTFISFANMSCAPMNETERGTVKKSIETAISVWEIIRGSEQSNGLVQTGFAAPKPPHQYRGGFYKGFVAVCARVDGRSGYYRFAGTSGGMHSEGEPLNAVLEKDEFSLIDMTEGAAEANAYIEPYSVPCPMYTDAGTELILPHSAIMNAAMDEIKDICKEFSGSSGSSADRNDGGISVMTKFNAKNLPMESITMSYNMGSAKFEAGKNAYEDMIAHLKKMIKTSEFKEKVTTLVPYLDEIIPAVHVLRIVCFLKH